MYQLLVYKFEPLTDEEKQESTYRNNRGMDNMYSNNLNRGNFKAMKALEVELTDEEFATVKRAVTQAM